MDRAVTVKGIVRVMILASGAPMACSSADPDSGFDSPVPGSNMYAISKAVREGDKSHIHDMIRCLESDDPVVRWTAIDGLERLTGQKYGYDFAGPWAERRRAIDRWKAAYPETAWQAGKARGTEQERPQR